jgi:hypothetical protein
MDMVGRFGKKFEKLSYLNVLYEINCAERTFLYLSTIYHDHKGGVIHIISSPSKMGFITPESSVESLYKEVCK